MLDVEEAQTKKAELRKAINQWKKELPSRGSEMQKICVHSSLEGRILIFKINHSSILSNNF